MHQKRPSPAHPEPSSSSGEEGTAGKSLRKKKLPRNVRVLAGNLSARARKSFDFADEATPTPVEVAARPSHLPPPPRPPHSPRARWTTALAVVAVLVASVLGLTRAGSSVPLFATRALRSVVSLMPTKSASASAFGIELPFGGDRSAAAAEKEPTGAVLPAPACEPLNREGHVSIAGGILVLPTTFVPDADGAYDLLLHFHGNTAVVKESAEVAKLNAAVAIVNLGIGSAPYEEAYAVPGTYEELLASIERGLVSRGVVNAHLRRVALSSWSAGYGAISTILQVRRKTEELDAVLVFDGIHCGWEAGALNARQMKPFVDIAKLAANDEMYFGITHSSIDPRAYASTTATSSYLLDAVGAVREARDPVRDAPKYLELASMNGAIAKKLEKVMEPISEAHKGSFHVIGYKGELPEHHMEHLFQMGATLLPELVARWSR